MVQNSQLIWMCDWTAESLSNTTEHFFNTSPVAAVNIEDRHRYINITVCGREEGGGEDREGWKERRKEKERKGEGGLY